VAQGEMVAELLRREGIDALFQKFGGPLIGLPAALARMTVDVPAESAARAKELLADLEYTGAAEALETGEAASAPEDGGEGDGDGHLLSRRYPPLAAGFALILPGGAHLYARRPWTALVLAIGVTGLVAVVAATGSPGAFDVAIAILIGIVVCDAVGGVRAARAAPGGADASRGAQLGRALGLLVIAALAGGLGRLAYDELFVEFKVRCTGSDLFVENHTGQPRTIEITTVEIVGSSTAGEVRQEVDARPETGCISCSDRALNVDVPGRLAGRCGGAFPDGVPAWLRPGESRTARPDALTNCHFAFKFVARKIGVPDDDPIQAAAVCTPPVSFEQEPAAGRLERIHRGADDDG
jgi:hypothetical protein